MKTLLRAALTAAVLSLAAAAAHGQVSNKKALSLDGAPLPSLKVSRTSACTPAR
jgi:hypothetical protein